jgi:hypothetical protein
MGSGTMKGQSAPLPLVYSNCSLSLWRVVRGSKLMHLDLIHGLLITLIEFMLSTAFISGNYYYAYIQLVSFNVTGIHYVHEHRLQYTWCNPLAFYLPLLNPPCSPFELPLLTWNPPGCDRIRPPRSQVACKLTYPFTTLSPIPPPSKFPEPRLLSTSL